MDEWTIQTGVGKSSPPGSVSSRVFCPTGRQRFCTILLANAFSAWLNIKPGLNPVLDLSLSTPDFNDMKPKQNCGFNVSNNLAEGLKSVICHIAYQNKCIASNFHFGWNSLRFIPLSDRCVIARDMLGRPPAAATSPVSADGLKLSTWLVWPTRRTWRIREVDMANQRTWPRCTAHRCGPHFGWLQRQRLRQ